MCNGKPKASVTRPRGHCKGIPSRSLDVTTNLTHIVFRIAVQGPLPSQGDSLTPDPLPLPSTISTARAASPPDSMRTALAIGAGRAILIESSEELQPLAVAKLLKALVDKEQPQQVKSVWVAELTASLTVEWELQFGPQRPGLKRRSYRFLSCCGSRFLLYT